MTSLNQRNPPSDFSENPNSSAGNISLLTAIFLVVANMIGTGVFTSLGSGS